METANAKTRKQLLERNQQIEELANEMLGDAKDSYVDVKKLLSITHSRELITQLSRFGPHFR